MTSGPVLLEVQDLRKEYPIYGGFFRRRINSVKALRGVSFRLPQGQTLGLVGESGCGKTTLGRCLVRLHDPDDGRILFQNQDVTHIRGEPLRQLRKQIQIVFQDPFASLNPRMTVGAILEEPLLIHKIGKTSKQRQDRVQQLLEYVGLPSDSVNRFPHEFSGGQRQRIGIARALAVEPQLIVLDEPVSALDVSVQAQVINLLLDLQERFQLTYVFIAHDLKVVEFISQWVAVMYLGHIVEIGTKAEVFENPKHPYTQALLSAIPEPDPKKSKKRIILSGDVPSPINPPSGCPFHTRCWLKKPECAQTLPALKSISPTHQARCLLIE